ncbi:MAG TPA: PAS domain-containing protein [Pyrinomonadaceae bacterium]|nr:PAS domain-containing protein [Pyrinomonadaceae bacterium]
MRSEEMPLGLVEFEADGTVLYYNRDSRDDSKGVAPEMVGRNLFAELMPAVPGEQLRLLVRQFLDSHAPAQSHLLSFARDGSAAEFRVLLARLHSRAAQQDHESVLMHIRETLGPVADGRS